MAEQIVREIWLFQKRRVPPIDIVAGSQIPIALEMKDYTIPTEATVKVYARPWGRETTYVQDATTTGNTVVFTPQDGFFQEGWNAVQLEIDGAKIPLALDVNGGVRLSDGGGGATPEAVRPLVERAEEAAAKAAEDAANAVKPLVTEASAAAESAAGQAAAAKSSADAAEKSAQGIRDSAAKIDKNANEVNQLKEDLGEQIGSQKFNGYYNLAKVANATVYRGKRIAQYNVSTYEPVLVDDALYTTVIMPIDKTFGNYNMLIGKNHPSSGIAMMRYKKDSVGAAVSYSQLNNLSWDASYDESKRVLSYLTNKIIDSGSQVDTYAFCFYNTESIVYPDIFPELNSGVLQLLKIIGKEQLTDDLRNTITNISNSLSVDIMLPNEIYSVIGHEHNIYFWNTIKCSNIHDYTIRVRGANYGSGIKNLGDCVRMKPTAAKKQVIIFNVYKNDALLKEKSTTIKMIADNRPSARKVIFIGDSMVENGYEIAELKKMFGEDMIFYGTRQGGQKDSSDTWQTVYHEGRSSWDSGEYLNKASKNNVANAFYNPSTSKFDFSYYMNNNASFNDVTDVFIQLGNNDADKMTKEQYVSNIQYIIDDIHKYNSSIKVFVCVPSPVVNDGYAYGTRNYVDVQYSKNHLFECGKHLIENVKNAICVPIYQNLDCYNDFPKTEVAFSARNPDKHTVCNDNVHPSKYGFYKFADTLYCAILGAYNS